MLPLKRKRKIRVSNSFVHLWHISLRVSTGSYRNWKIHSNSLVVYGYWLIAQVLFNECFHHSSSRPSSRNVFHVIYYLLNFFTFTVNIYLENSQLIDRINANLFEESFLNLNTGDCRNPDFSDVRTFFSDFSLLKESLHQIAKNMIWSSVSISGMAWEGIFIINGEYMLKIISVLSSLRKLLSAMRTSL